MNQLAPGHSKGDLSWFSHSVTGTQKISLRMTKGQLIDADSLLKGWCHGCRAGRL